MKIYFRLIPVFFFSTVIYSQSSFFGSWEGKINVGVPLRIVLHFSKDSSNNYKAVLESPDQGSQKIAASVQYISSDSIQLEIEALRVNITGKLIGDTLIKGVFTQGSSFPLDMKRINKVIPLKRPQTPKPPFPYESRDIIFRNSDSSIQYGGTITIPGGRGKFPAILLISGSGQQNRDEEIAGHKPFAVIADYLTRQGYIVLRMDDRGMGKTSGDVSSATSADFADDASLAIDYLLRNEQVDKKQVGIIGHSEGGMIGQIVAARRKDISFLVMLAGPGAKVIDLMIAQNEAIIKKSGLDSASVHAYNGLYEKILRGFIATDSASAESVIDNIVNEWVAKTPSSIVLATTGITNDSSKAVFINSFLQQLQMPWFRYFLQYDPAANLLKTRAKIFAINGSEDIQVVPGLNLDGIRKTFWTTGGKRLETLELPGLNHLLQECKTCTIEEYAELEETISPVALKAISDWLQKNTSR